MPLSSIGEFGIIDRIRNLIGEMPDNVVLGPGDDTAVFQTAPGKEVLITTDGMAEGVHFDLSYTTFFSLGWKSIASNLSDIAAMGGLPQYAVVTLAIPDNWQVNDIEDLIKGMVQCNERYGCSIIGGDITRSKADGYISVTITGEVYKGRAVLRSSAANGDILCVSGPLGAARTGLEVLMSGNNLSEYKKSIKHFTEPAPRIELAQLLVKEQVVSSMIDISDGLSSEINHICKSSSCGCILWAEDIPLEKETYNWAEKTGQDPDRLALDSGEEYELLFTVQRNADPAWLRNNSIYIIGEMVSESEGIILKQAGKESELKGRGWNHFSG